MEGALAVHAEGLPKYRAPELRALRGQDSTLTMSLEEVEAATTQERETHASQEEWLETVQQRCKDVTENFETNQKNREQDIQNLLRAKDTLKGANLGGAAASSFLGVMKGKAVAPGLRDIRVQSEKV